MTVFKNKYKIVLLTFIKLDTSNFLKWHVEINFNKYLLMFSSENLLALKTKKNIFDLRKLIKSCAILAAP